MLSPKQRRSFRKILAFGVLWGIVGLIYSLVEKGLLGDSPIYPSTTNPYDGWKSVIANPIFSFFGGILFGSFEVLYFRKMFSNRSFLIKVLIKTCFYVLFIIFFLLTITLLRNSLSFSAAPWDPLVLLSLKLFFWNFAFWSVVGYIGQMIGFTILLSEISDNIGQEVFRNFLFGKYHHPVQEERIFMFLDMRASTTIAEKLGHIQYFELLKAYYAEMTEAILQTSGLIYQYVGDELVLSWPLESGLKNTNCIRCYFLIRDTLQSKENWFQDQFGLVPEFKAGMHCGSVTAGEIGDLKKEILFTGDVLNTTARIQGLCNALDSDFLISERLFKLLDLGPSHPVNNLGEHKLRGRDESINLYSIKTN